MGKWRTVSLAGVAASMLLVSACGSEAKPANTDLVQPAAGSAAPNAGTGEAGNAPAGNTPAGSKKEEGESEAAGELAVRADAKLGPIVTDGEGRTLYRFDKDTPDPAKSNCDGDCAKTWPPVPAAEAKASSGLNPDLVGSVTRSDGTEQLTVGGWPMYRYAKDAKAGDTKGQNVGGTWFASAPDGAKSGKERPKLGVLKSPELGEVLTDKNGKTLYLFTKDTPWPMKTACDDKCLEKWTPSEPVSAADAKAAGIDPKLLFTFTTPNGTKQEAINCWPAYTFKGDKEPGQTNGQGVGGTWFAIKKDAKNDRGKTIPAAKGKAGGGAEKEGSSYSGGAADSGSSADSGSTDTYGSTGGGYGY
ncbi:SCO0930 family lipoprotein [Streptomyces sp. bgisy100]|uniref:SCO0930 family lipoprotein n=1 Tax=Streptomyces sp. bgisy100 TaxID=3413783 RepID=UPI003D7113B4